MRPLEDDRPFERPDAPGVPQRVEAPEPTLGELTTRQAVEDANVVGRAFAIWLRDNPSTAAAAAFRAGFDLARSMFLKEAPPVSRAGAAARMQQLRALCRAGHLRREELDWLGAFYGASADA